VVRHAELPMSGEPAFLIAAARRFLHPDSPLPNPETIDWAVLLRLAAAHAVIPMLYSAMRDVPIPDGAAEELRRGIDRSAAWTLMQSRELAHLGGLFEQHAIPVVALKGPTLSRYLYGDLEARSSGDIDVLVKREDVLRSRDVLMTNGYRVANSLHWNSPSACLRLRGCEMAFESASGVSVDVHWRLLPPHFASAFDELDAWKSLGTETLGGRRVPTLAPGPLLMFLCSHGAKHMFERVAWICDIARFLIVTPGLDWKAMVAAARRACALRQLSLGVQLAVDLLGAPPVSELPRDVTVEALAQTVLNRLLTGATPPAAGLETTRYCLRLMERPGQRLRLLSGEYLTPSEAEFRVLQLPPWLFFAYYPFRPVRLFWRNAIRRSGAE